MAQTVVLREDDPDLRHLVHELLADSDYLVCDVETIEDLLRECKRRSPCVALIDSTSPTEFDLWHIGPLLAEIGVPAVAFTAHARATEQFETDPSGFVGVVSKPFDADEFVDIVNAICWEDHDRAAS